MKKFSVTILKVATLLLSFQAAASNDHLAPRTPSDVRSSIIQGSLDKQGYEIRKVEYVSVDGRAIKKELYFIDSASGAQNAYNNAGLSFEAYQETVEDFNSPLTFSKHTSTPLNSISSSDDLSSGMLTIIDAEADAISSQSQADAYIAKWGLDVDEDLDSDSLNSEYGSSCPRKYKCRTKQYQKSINKDIDKSFELYKGAYGSVGMDVIGSVKADTTARVDYRYKKKWGIKYKVRVDFLDSKLNYRFEGSLGLYGKAERTFKGKEFELFQAKVYDNIFMVGFIPVQVDVKTYVRAGTGDLKLSAEGEIGMVKPFLSEGTFSYVCDKSKCVKQSESFNNADQTLNSNNLAYQVTAKAEIEPYINAAIRGRLYWGSVYAEVGLQPSIPLKLFGYVGNKCGDGDGDFVNERVTAGLLSADIRAGITWKTKVLQYKSNRNYKQFYRGNLGYKDLLSPSTALSPIIETTINGNTVTLKTSLRNCIVNELDSEHQDFTIYWGNKGTKSISNLNDTISSTKILNSGYHTIKVKHKGGAYTQKEIHITSSGGGGFNPPVCPTPLPIALPPGIIGVIACPTFGKAPAGYICSSEPPECDDGLAEF
ncbi:hypothetical protein I6F48_12435 [Pseudoalteromonas sp. SWYJ118]|uniref:hypothetical protein n=1 Tax=unclassified Pseudoalteromonas TaxID=194690 RepID=UPI0013FD2257|nr:MULTISPECIES: hypothetical protein [unclassified Pseudoalteromonas]MBH0076359.1 hypothetical protein [Pseudoalteromonas sp. SWYJ118]